MKNHGVSYACLEHFGVTLPNEIAPAGGILRHLKEAPQVLLHVASGGHQAEDQQQARRIHLKETQQKNKHPQRLGSQILKFQVWNVSEKDMICEEDFKSIRKM